MDERTAAQLSDWAEREMALTPNSASALRGAAAEFGRATLDDPHVPAEPDADLGAVLERVSLAIAGHNVAGRDITSGDSPDPGDVETS